MSAIYENSEPILQEVKKAGQSKDLKIVVKTGTESLNLLKPLRITE